jgi:hypothetical protein
VCVTGIPTISSEHTCNVLVPFSGS